MLHRFRFSITVRYLAGAMSCVRGFIVKPVTPEILDEFSISDNADSGDPQAAQIL